MKPRFFTASEDPRVVALRSQIIGLAATIELVVPGGRNKALALTHLEDLQMRANRGIFAPGGPRVSAALEHLPANRAGAPAHELGMSAAAIARICHDANRRLQQLLGDSVSPAWEDWPEGQVGVVMGVVSAIQGRPRRSCTTCGSKRGSGRAGGTGQ